MTEENRTSKAKNTGIKDITVAVVPDTFADVACVYIIGAKTTPINTAMKEDTIPFVDISAMLSLDSCLEWYINKA